MQLIAMMHNEVIENVDQAQIKHKHVYALWKGRYMFVGFMKCNVCQDEKARKEKLFKFKLGKAFLVCEIS